MNFSSQSRHLLERIYSVNQISFESVALDVFEFQFNFNEIYRKYCVLLKKNPENVQNLKEIPFLPIEFFKTENVIVYSKEDASLTFYSSGTGGEKSHHYIFSKDLYNYSILKCFEKAYGNPNQYIFYCLTPSPDNNPNSSLGYMADFLCRESNHPKSKVYDINGDSSFLLKDLGNINDGRIPFILGVSFAIWDFTDSINFSLPEKSIVMETGGMKGRKIEPIKEEFHQILKNTLQISDIHSEYGMAELMSQCYAKDGINFELSQFQKILIREVNDPYSYMNDGEQGGINMIDLNNLYSCSFIETKDLGIVSKQYPNTFRILGRFDNSDQRGCSLLYA